MPASYPPTVALNQLRIQVEPGQGHLVTAVLVCRVDHWVLREDVLDGEFDLAFSRMATALRRRLRLNDEQMMQLEALRHRSNLAYLDTLAA